MDCKAFPEGSNNNQKDGTSSSSERKALENNNIRFTVNYEEIGSNKDEVDPAKCVELSENVLSTVPWKIAACKITKTNDTKTENYLIISLTPNAKWLIDLEGEIELVPNDGKTAQNKKFDKKCISSSAPARIEIFKWEKEDAIKDYIDDECKLKFDFTLSISSLKRIPTSSQVQQITTKFYVKVPNVASTIYSPEVSVAGIKWKILTKKNDDFLAIYLYAVDEDMGLNESWEVEFTSNLLSWEDKLPGFPRTFKTNFSWEMPAYGFNKFLKWDELHKDDKKYVKNGAALFQVELKVTPKSA